ncbi:MAG: FAD-binding protein, partial [Bacteroidota bacterium]
GLCDPDVVRMVIEEGHERVQELITWGARFDKEDDGEYNLGREGGHSENRILHYKDITGWEVQRTLNETAKKHENINILEYYFALDILTQHHLGHNVTRLTPDIECYGAYVFNKETQEIDTILAKMTVMCTGGAGQIYRNTTTLLSPPVMVLRWSIVRKEEWLTWSSFSSILRRSTKRRERVQTS